MTMTERDAERRAVLDEQYVEKFENVFVNLCSFEDHKPQTHISLPRNSFFI